MTDKAKIAAHLRGMLDELTQPTGIEAIVCADIAKRQRLGINKYGTTVADNPLSLREWLQHAYKEEFLDQSVYLARAMAEIERPDESIELAQALEQLRALKIVEVVAALQIGGANSGMPTPFQAGYQLACEEIETRLRTEEWDGCLKPIGEKT